MIEKGNGRIETRVYFLCTDADLLNMHREWSNLNGIGMMKSRIQKNGVITEETRYYITSLHDVKEVAKAVRQHWGVENSLHPYSMYEDKICRDYRDGKVTKEQLDKCSTCDMNCVINNGLSEASKEQLKHKTGEEIVDADIAEQMIK